MSIKTKKPAPIKVHSISFQSKTPFPGVKIVMNSFAIYPVIEITTDQLSRFFNKEEFGLDNSGITTYNKAGNPIPGRKLGATPRR